MRAHIHMHSKCLDAQPIHEMEGQYFETIEQYLGPYGLTHDNTWQQYELTHDNTWQQYEEQILL